METFFLRSVEVPALVLSDLDLPVPGGGGPGVQVEGDGDAGGTDGDEHVLTGVIAADNRRRREPGDCD